MYQHSLQKFRTSQEHGDAALVIDQARRAAIGRGDYAKAREYRLELAILLALREATAREIKSGEYFEE